MAKKNRLPKSLVQPQSRQPVAREDASSANSLAPAWQFNRCDLEDPHYGWQKLTKEQLDFVLDKLRSFEGQTWGELLKASGGKGEGKGTNHHQLPAAKFIEPAKKRLIDLKLDDQEWIFSLRLTNTIRLYGIREGRILLLLWHDPHHGTRQGAYPTANTL